MSESWFQWVDSYALLLARAFAFALATGLLILFTARWHLRFSADEQEGVQKVHTRLTPRVGGVAFMVSLVIMFKWSMRLPVLDVDLTGLRSLLGVMLIAAIPAFGFGLMEDLTGRIGILSRLLATAVSGLMAWWVTGVALTDVDIWGLNHLLYWTPFAVAFTVLGVAALANGFNMIDGANGLASGLATLAFFVFSLMAWRVGDVELHLLSLVCAGATLGFFAINWPWGRLFLGDGGAYSVGFFLAWIAVMLKVRHGQISAWALAMVLSYPIIELLFTVFRRLVRRQHPGMPDRFHLHSLLRRRFADQWCQGRSSTFRNSATGFSIILISALGHAAACWTLFSVPESLAASAVMVVVYLTVYARLVYFRWVWPWRLLKTSVAPPATR